MSLEWEVVGGGALRFRGGEAVRAVLDLIQGDDNYLWSIPGDWTTPLWIDVYPATVGDQNLLLELVGK